MKKIIFLIHTLGGGGAEKVLVNLVNSLDKSKYNVTVMTVIDTGIFKKDLNSDINYKSIFKIPKFFKKNKNSINNDSGSLLSKNNKFVKIGAKLYSSLWKIIPAKIIHRVFIGHGYDIEVAFLEGITSKIISASNNKQSRKLSWIHVDLINETKSQNVFINSKSEKKCYEKFNTIVCVSDVVRRQFILKFNYDENKVKTRYNPIDSDEILQKSTEYINDLPISNKFIICTIGRLNNQKGYDRLLRIHNRLIKEGYDYELWIIGDGNKKNSLEEYINQNNLQESVKLLGFKSNPYKYLNIADMFVCSSRAEGFSTVASEAVILGKPIVTTNCSGMTELLGNNNEYGIVTQNDEESLYLGIKKVLDDESLYNCYKEKVILRGKFFNKYTSVVAIENLLYDNLDDKITNE